MSGLTGALCGGKWWLFESVEINDHVEAAEICGRCPAIEACRELLHGQLEPTGTWAGVLLGTTRQPREHGTSRGWGQHRHYREPICGPCRVAHRADLAARAQVAG